jgi:L-ribulose-5-phosphate 3-epimerase
MRSRSQTLGFMQGRLSAMVENRIQAFPASQWELEFTKAQQIDIHIMEWTIDSLDFENNPIINSKGQETVRKLSNQFDIRIPSVTCDYFMENPFWKSKDVDMDKDLRRIIRGMREIDSNLLVLPLVDNSSASTKPEGLVDFFMNLESILASTGTQIAFELDLNPSESLMFISEFPTSTYGINYDIGNSASLGFDPNEELSLYGNRILNVHVKDRPLNGSTVRLGHGAADFKSVLIKLAEIGYQGNFILQTARAPDGDHVGELLSNIDYFMGISLDD